jgi:hypothetical protein
VENITDVETGTGYVNPKLFHGSYSYVQSLAHRFGCQTPYNCPTNGLDISFDAIPPRDWLPPNMSLHRWDTTAEVPEQLLGVYDVVHVRHFAFVLQQSDLKAVLDNLLKLLSMPSNFYNPLL